VKTAVHPVTVKQGDEFTIIFLSDMHIGSSLFARDEFVYTTDYIKKLSKQKQVIVMLLGDVIEGISVNDKRFDWEQIDPTYPRESIEAIPQYQCEDAKYLLHHIADNIKFTVEGNHEEKVRKVTKALDPTKYLMDNCFNEDTINLGYSGFVAFPVMFTHREDSDNERYEYIFKVAVNHGAGGGMKPGASINSLYDLLDAPCADIIAMGHLHHGINDRHEKFDYHPRRGFYAFHQIVCSVGSFMHGKKAGVVAYTEKLKGKTYPISFTQIDIKCGKTKQDCEIRSEIHFPSGNGFNKISRIL
jgi:predicted phosphodiesterase